MDPKFEFRPLAERYLEEKAADIRTEILKMIHNAQSGHPGGSLSATDIMADLIRFVVDRVQLD